MLSVSRITHVALRVADLERSLAFYQDRLGFREMLRLDRDGRVWLVYLRITDTQFLELFPEGVGSVAGPEVTGLNHLCLEIRDIDTALAELSAAGVALLRPKALGADGNWQAWIEDPDGNRIELMQMAPESLQVRAIAAMAV